MPITRQVRRTVGERAQNRCEYCRTPEWLSGLACEIDHIIPRAKEGGDTLDNLCLACSACNGKRIIGLTACGRATLDVLQMNHELIVAARALWLQAGLDPH
jgi:hypothetical protein